jgi:serine/threonine protein kinase
MATLVRAGEFVGPGEEAAAAYLERELPDSWIVIANKELVGREGGSREVDFIVVGTHSIFVIEEKSWSGPLHGNDNGWVLPSGESFASPLRNVDGLSRRLAGMLRSNVALLRDAVENRHFVFGRVLLSSPRAQLYVHDARASEQVLRLEGCEQELERWDRLQGSVASIAKFRKLIAARLTGLSDRPKIPRQVSSYDVVEFLPSNGPIRVLRARHRDGSERILKLIPRSPTLDEAKKAAEERVGLREYNALRQLASLGVSPPVDPYFSWDQDNYWVVPSSIPSGRSLRADRTAAAPQEQVIGRVAQAAFQSLASVHSAGITHRALNPDRVFLGPNTAVSFTDFVIARIQDTTSIAEYADQLEPADAYRAPESLVGLDFAVPASDVFSLAASLWYWVTGQEFDASDDQPRQLRDHRPDLTKEVRGTLDSVLLGALIEDERTRPSAAEIAEQLAVLNHDRGRATVALPRSMSVGTVVEEQYRIERVLGEGATAVTYLARDLESGLDFVLKRIKNPELISRLATTEFRFLLDLVHPGLPRVYDLRHAGSSFHLKLEYIPGSTIREVAPRYRGDVEFCVSIGQQILATLTYLELRGLVHRDISPGNIMIVEEGAPQAKLIDFGLAARQSEGVSAVGTPLYRAPEMDREGGRWLPRCDVYSLGVVLFEALTGRLPFAVQEGRTLKSQLLTASSHDLTQYGTHLVNALLHACAPDPGARYQSANEFARALAVTDAEPATTPPGEELINPTVGALRTSYRNSRLGNADNRGLDTDFARRTYVPTRLDDDLVPRLISGEHRLAVLSGNPGDGKTAFLERFGAGLRARGAEIIAADPAGWRLRYQDRTYAALYDASESHGHKGADDLMHDVLRPLAGNHPPRPDYVGIIAANDGRLLDFFERFGGLQYGWLWPQLQSQLLDNRYEEGEVLLIDLKRRSLVQGDGQDRGVFEQILNQFVAHERWTICEGCVARNECPMRANALTFIDPLLSGQVRDRLRDLLLAVHLRRERRPTLRDLRSALSFLLTHDLSCEEVHEERRRGIVPISDSGRLYYNAAVSGAGVPDLLLEEWHQLDPGGTPAPALERYLFLHSRRSEAPMLRELLLESSVRPRVPVTPGAEAPAAWMVSFKRRFYFEGREARSTPPARMVPPGSTLLPYRHFDAFRDALRVPAVRGGDGDLLMRLLTGLSVADGVPPSAATDFLALRVSERAGEVTVIKRFPHSEFVLLRPPLPPRYVEAVPDRLTLQHHSGSPELSIGLDLFELLMRAADGQLPGSVEQSALLEDITTFKIQLLARPTTDVMIVEGGRRFHTVRVIGGRIVRTREGA